MTKRRSWASWFPIANPGDYQQCGPDSQLAEMNTYHRGEIYDHFSQIKTNQDRERAYLGLPPIVHTFTPGGK